MTSPTDDFNKAVESAHKRLATIVSANQKALDENALKYTDARLADDAAIAEALASIQAATVELLEGLKKEIPTSAHIPAKFASDGYIEADLTNSYNQAVEDSHEVIDQLIKDLSK